MNKNRERALAASVAALALVWFFVPNGYLVFVGSAALLTGLIGLALYLPVALLHELPLHGAGLVGLAAYLTAEFAHGRGGVALLVAGALAIAIVAAVSAFTGIPSIAVSGLYFAVISLTVQMGLEKVAFSWPWLTGGMTGRSILQPGSHGYLTTQRLIYLAVGLVCGACAGGVWFLKRSRFGRRAALVGAHPEGAQVVGISPSVTKLAVFAVTGAIAAAAGVLLTLLHGTPPSPLSFNLIWSIIYLALPIAAGLRLLSAIWVVAVVFTATPIALEARHFDSSLMAAVIILASLLVSQRRGLRGRGGGRGARREAERVTGQIAKGSAYAYDGDGAEGGAEQDELRTGHARLIPVSVHANGHPVLACRDVSVRFGGLLAVGRVSLSLQGGERAAVVGANGAGKSTLLNAISGFVPLEQGGIELEGREITGLRPPERAKLGIARSFQRPRLADYLSVKDNVLIRRTSRRDDEERTNVLLCRFGLWGLREWPLVVLPHGIRRKVEIVRSLVGNPSVVLLDEPVSGLSDNEMWDLLEILGELQATEGWPLLLVEHDLGFITALCSRIIVMDQGGVVFNGPADAAVDDERVRSVYLGRELVGM